MAMERLSLLVLLCAAAPLASCQESTKSTAPPKPDSGSFVQNTYRSDFFGFSYPLPGEWNKSRMAGDLLPSGAYYLFIGARHTGHSLMNRVSVVVAADAESNYPSGLSAQEYLSALIRAQVTQSNAKVIRQPFAFISGGADFYRADYRRAENGATIYSSWVCTKRNSYWLNWSFDAPSERELDDAVSTLQHVSFDQQSPSQRLR
jgi:hypothetical protein